MQDKDVKSDSSESQLKWVSTYIVNKIGSEGGKNLTIINKEKLTMLIRSSREVPQYMKRLQNVDLVGADLSDTDLSFADLANADLTKAKLFRANVSNANLFNAKLEGADLSNAKLISSVLVRCKMNNLICKDAIFDDAIIDDDELVNYLRNNGAKNVPPAVKNKKQLELNLEQRGIKID